MTKRKKSAPCGNVSTVGNEPSPNAKHNIRKNQKLVLAITCRVDGQTREVIRGFVAPDATVGNIGDLIDLLNHVYERAKFDMVPRWEDVP